MALTTLIIWLIIGGLAGWLAGSLMKVGRPYGLFGDIILGVLGGVAGGWLLGLFGLGASGFIGSLVTAFIGAVILIWIVRKIKKS